MQTFQKPASNAATPLAEQMRPETLNDFVGQKHLLGKGKILNYLISSGKIPSLIFWGPPGCGKTTLALLLAKKLSIEFVYLSAVSQGTVEIKKLVEEIKETKQRKLLFVDEIHRYNKLQQNIFLPYVENGSIILIGATTENPSFEIISPLLSRCRVLVLERLTREDLCEIVKRALTDKEKGLGNKKIKIKEKDLDFLIDASNGDARNILNALEIASSFNSKKSFTITTNDLVQALQAKVLSYDKKYEEHYNTISALHKAMRGSDPQASVYYLARMLEAGEDPLYIARRLIRFASEDIGIAEPNALVQAVSAYTACHYIGVPECNVVLTQCVVYLSLAHKSNSLYVAYEKAKGDVYKTLNEPIPLKLRNAPTKLMKNIGYGKDYKYAHQYEKHHVKGETYLPEKLIGHKYYIPSDQGLEKRAKEKMRELESSQ